MIYYYYSRVKLLFECRSLKFFNNERIGHDELHASEEGDFGQLRQLRNHWFLSFHQVGGIDAKQCRFNVN